MTEPRVRLPDKIRKGEPFEIKTLITHPMESGQRKDAQGRVIPRMIVNRFTCRLNGEEIFSADLAAAIAANPYLSSSPSPMPAAGWSSSGSTMPASDTSTSRR
jgi:sulfur-oxidizing protein SoxZ